MNESTTVSKRKRPTRGGAMSRKRYTVDWSDRFYPTIKATRDEEGVSFAQAKRDLIASLQCDIKHARALIQQLRRLKAADVSHPTDWPHLKIGEDADDYDQTHPVYDEPEDLV